MANVPVGGPVAPGIVQNQNQYPQYGVGGGSPGNAAGWNIVTANNATDKQNDMNKGYLVWFSSKDAAHNFISSESSAFGSGSIGLSNPLAALAGIARGLADFVGTIEHIWKILTNWRMWASLGWLVLGVIVLLAGISFYLTGSVNPVQGARMIASRAL